MRKVGFFKDFESLRFDISNTMTFLTYLFVKKSLFWLFIRTVKVCTMSFRTPYITI